MIDGDTIIETVVVVLLCIISAWLGHATTKQQVTDQVTDEIRQQAIDSGVGEYFLDDQNHKQFRFITVENEETTK